MVKSNKAILFMLYILFFTFLFSEKFDFSIGNLKYDYSNLKFSYFGNEGDASLSIGKFSLSTQNSEFQFSETNEDIVIKIGPSKLILQNVLVNLFERNTRNNIKFNLGSLKFDIMNLSLDASNTDRPNINTLNTKFSTSNLTLDLSQVSALPQETKAIFEQLGISVDQVSINRATISASYNQQNTLSFDLDAVTSLANLKINIKADVDEVNPNLLSNFQMFKVTLSNLSLEMRSIVALFQAQSGLVMPMKNGSITFDVRDILNNRQNTLPGR